MTSIPASAPRAASAVPHSPASSSASARSDDPNSFENYLKSVAKRALGDQPEQGTAFTKLSMGGNDKAGKDSKQDENDKKKLLLANTSVPVPVTALSESKPFRLSLPIANTSVKADEQSPDAKAAGTADSEPSQNLKATALKNSVAETRANAPVAFGVNLSNLNGAKMDALKTNTGKVNDAQAKSNSPGIGKITGEVSRPAGSKSSSGNQQQHPDSSHDDNQPSPGGNGGKAGSAFASSPTQPAATTHAAAPSPNEIPVVSAVQNAYAAAPPAGISKTVAAAPKSAIVEPAQTPSLRPQNIDLKIGGPDNSQVDVRISQRAGDVQVTVRTPDGDLAQSLRQHLPELSDRLSQTGVSGAIWQPQAAQAANTGANDAGSRYSDDAQTQQQAQQHSGENPHGGQRQGNQEAAWLSELYQAEKETN